MPLYRMLEERGLKNGVIQTSERDELPHDRRHQRVEETEIGTFLFAKLTERERTVCSYIIEGCTSEAISLRLDISINSVVCYRKRDWAINGLPERFPTLKVIWIESGLAWISFLMQRLDHEFLMRQSDAPLLKRLPSEYMREMFYTSQPIEVTNMKLLEATFEAINAETQLLWASDWPHWDFDTPARRHGNERLQHRAAVYSGT